MLVSCWNVCVNVCKEIVLVWDGTSVGGREGILLRVKCQRRMRCDGTLTLSVTLLEQWVKLGTCKWADYKMAIVVIMCDVSWILSY